MRTNRFNDRLLATTFAACMTMIAGPDFVRTTSVTGPLSFQGTQTLDQFVTSESYGFHQYFTLEGLVVVVHGMTRFERPFYDDPRSMTVSYSPPLRSVSNYSLRVGETVTENPSVVVDGEQAAASPSSLKFVGFEDASTPAGVFKQTCHFAQPRSGRPGSRGVG